LQHRELVTQHKDLDILRAITSTAQHEQVNHEADKGGRNGPRSDARSVSTGPLTQRVTPAQHARTSNRHPHAAHANAKPQVNVTDAIFGTHRIVLPAMPS
jgi:hypothetical protein